MNELAKNKHAVCLTIDGLHCGYLGCYGNSVIDTPVIDHLASQSFLLDQAFVSCPSLEARLEEWWQGRHAANSKSQLPSASLMGTLCREGIQTRLLTDDPTVAALGHEFDVVELAEFDSPEELTEEPIGDLPETPEESALGKYFTWVIDRLDESTDSEASLTWLHTKGLLLPWDAPETVRELYFDADELSETIVDPTSFDPDVLELHREDPGWLRAMYSAQVTTLDDCLLPLIGWIDRRSRTVPLCFSLASVRGFGLGEHGEIGLDRTGLHAEWTQTPWMIRFPDQLGWMHRSVELVQGMDLPATLIDWWFGGKAIGDGRSLLPTVREDSEAASTARDRVVLLAPCETGTSNGSEEAAARGAAVKTDRWYWQGTPGQADSLRVFAKPDDRWEQNEISNRCGELLEEMETMMRLSLEAIAGRSEPTEQGNEDADAFPPLPDVLLTART